MCDDFERQIAGVAALAGDVRRRLYEYVVSQPHAVGRDEAALAVGVKRPLAAFHLDKLVDEGLLDTDYRRLTDRRGPGAGRPAKVYRRSQRQIDVTLPPRQYDLAASVLAAAVHRSIETGEDIGVAMRPVAVERGHALASDDADAGEPVARLWRVLRRVGYEPRHDGADIRLANCPFHSVAQEFTSVVCSLNLALCEGLAAGLGVNGVGLRPVLQPHAGWCCVAFQRRD